MYLDYDAADNFALNELHFRNNYGAMTVPSWDLGTMAAPLDAVNKAYTERYVRDAPVSGDIKTYDFANLYIGVESQGSVGRVGALYIDYDIEFRTPQMKSQDSTQELRCNNVGNFLNPFATLVSGTDPTGFNKGKPLFVTTNGKDFLNTGPGYFAAFAAGAGTAIVVPYIQAVGSSVITGLHNLVNASSTLACNWFKIACLDPDSGFSFQEPGSTAVAHVDLQISRIDRETYDKL